MIPYRRFGTTYRRIFKGVKISGDWTDGLYRNVPSNYNYPLRTNPEERSSHLLRGGSLKLRDQLTYMY